MEEAHPELLPDGEGENELPTTEMRQGAFGGGFALHRGADAPLHARLVPNPIERMI